MRRKVTVVLVLALVVGGVFLYQTARPSHAMDNPSCISDPFEVEVLQGPSKGLSLDGSLTFNVAADGSLMGTFTPEKGSGPVQVVGQANGRAVNLVFDLGKDTSNTTMEKYIFGVGTAVNVLSTCDGRVGGMFVGPQNEDSGYWGGAIKRNPGVK